VIDYLAFAGQGRYLSGSFLGVGEWANGVWTLTKRETIGADVKLINGVALGYDGKLWIASSNDLLFRAGGAWQAIDVSGLDRMPFFAALQTSPTGDIFAAAGNYLGKITPGDEPPRVEKIEIPGSNAWGYFELAFSPDGHVGLGSIVCDLARVDPADPTSPWLRHAEPYYGCEGLTAIALDGRKRMWVASRAGLDVLGPAEEHVAFPSSSIPELVGTIKSIAVVGLGPERLPTAGKLATGKLTGKLLRNGKPVAKAKLEMCPQPTMFANVDPCAHSKARHTATSGKDGTFTIADVPLGNYGVVVHVDGKWQFTWVPDFGVHMREGETYDIGGVKLPES
jgi:hypothetical protein